MIKAVESINVDESDTYHRQDPPCFFLHGQHCIYDLQSKDNKCSGKIGSGTDIVLEASGEEEWRITPDRAIEVIDVGNDIEDKVSLEQCSGDQ